MLKSLIPADFTVNIFSLTAYFVYVLLKVITLASNALEGFRNEAKKMVVALVDMERAFVPPQHFIRLVQRRLVHFIL